MALRALASYEPSLRKCEVLKVQFAFSKEHRAAKRSGGIARATIKNLIPLRELEGRIQPPVCVWQSYQARH